MVYIYNNPVKHGFCDAPDKWRFSSFNSIISNKPTQEKRTEVVGMV